MENIGVLAAVVFVIACFAYKYGQSQEAHRQFNRDCAAGNWPGMCGKGRECPHHPYGWRWDDEQGWRPTSAETQAVFDADDEDRAFAAEQGHTEPCPICRVNRDEGTGMPDFDCPNSWLDVPEGQEPPPGMCIDGYVRPAA